MSNRKKAKAPWLGRRARPQRELDGRLGLPAQRVAMPKSEREVLKTVPAKIADEVVGTAILYDDGTTDIILNDEISDEARKKMGDVAHAFNAETGSNFSVGSIDKKLVITEE